MPVDRKCPEDADQAEMEVGEQERKDFEAMFAWAAKEGALGLEQLEVKYFLKKETGDLVRGLAARQAIAGPVLLPSTLLLSADTEDELAWKLSLEHRKVVLGTASFWAPWFKTLPSYDELPCIDIKFASEQLLRHFEDLPVVASVRKWRESVAKRWEAGVRVCRAASGCTHVGANEDKEKDKDEKSPTPDDLLPLLSDLEWADFVVQSRVFVPPPKFSLMPFADMLNTSPEPANVEVFQDVEVDLPEECEAAPADSYYALVLAEGKKVQCGEELLQGYTTMDNAKRLFRGGFLLPNNPCQLPPLPSEASAEKVRRLIDAELPGKLSVAELQLATSLSKLAEEYLAPAPPSSDTCERRPG